MNQNILTLRLKDLLPAARGILLIFTIGAFWYFFKHTSIGEALQNYEWVRLKITESGPWGPLILILAGSISIACGFPRLAFSAIAGFVSGFFMGSIVGLAATMVACLITFYYAKSMGRSFVEKRFSNRIQRFEKLLSKNSFLVTLVVRLFPVGNNLITNLLAGVSSVRPVPYFLASLTGYIPQTLIFALVGSGIRKETWLRGTLSLALFFISILIMIVLLKKLKAEDHDRATS